MQQTDDADDLKYADTVKMACLLCLRQFHSVEEIKRHNALSTLHKVFCSPLTEACGSMGDTNAQVFY
jgi:hypothetical protein